MLFLTANVKHQSGEHRSALCVPLECCAWCQLSSRLWVFAGQQYRYGKTAYRTR